MGHSVPTPAPTLAPLWNPAPLCECVSGPFVRGHARMRRRARGAPARRAAALGTSPSPPSPAPPAARTVMRPTGRWPCGFASCVRERKHPSALRASVCRAHSAKHSNSVVSGSHDVGLDAVAPLLNPILLSVTRACKAAKKCKAQVFLSAFYCAAFGCADFFFCAFYWELNASIAP